MSSGRVIDDAILHLPSWLTESPGTFPLGSINLVYFVPGNPGLISYYSSFLKLLHEHNSNAIVAGASLGGFETTSLRHERDEEIEVFYSAGFEKKTWDLGEQVVLTHERLERLVGSVREKHPSSKGREVNVVLMGHSVGAWIAMEVVRRQHEAFHHSPSIVNDMKTDVSTTMHRPSYSIASTMLLTPTIHNISSSPSGKIATPVLSNLPFFPALLQLGASTLTSALPLSWVRSLVAKVTGMKSQEAIDVTTAFLLTPDAV